MYSILGANSSNTAMTIKNSGQVNFGAGLGIGGTAAANTLDDYEEGSWTGTLTGASSAPSTAVTATGYYTKIGNMVTLWIEFNNRNITGASGTVKITGQPFTPASAAFPSSALASLTSAFASVK